jgi:hypothetical protein
MELFENGNSDFIDVLLAKLERGEVTLKRMDSAVSYDEEIEKFKSDRDSVFSQVSRHNRRVWLYRASFFAVLAIICYLYFY